SSASSSPTRSGTPSAASCSTCSATCPRKANASDSKVSSSAPNGSRAGASSLCTSGPRRPAPPSPSARSDRGVPERLRHAPRPTPPNRLAGQKVAIVSDRPQTTRTAIRGVRTTSDDQIVFVDTPGLHKPRTQLGERTNQRAEATLDEVDVVCLLVEANTPIGRG